MLDHLRTLPQKVSPQQSLRGTSRRVQMQGDEKFKKDRFVLSIAFSPNGQRLACGSQDGTVAVFDVSSGKFLHALEGHFKPVRSLTFTPGTTTMCAIMRSASNSCC